VRVWQIEITIKQMKKIGNVVGTVGGLEEAVAAPSGVAAEATTAASPVASSASFAGVLIAAVAAAAALSSCFPGCAPVGGFAVAGSGSAMTAVATVPLFSCGESRSSF
jgi:hypothetical protein